MKLQFKYLITGCNGGLGKFLFDNLPNATGLHRTNYKDICSGKYDTIIHCAFNKTNEITDYYQYLEDNIFLTNRLFFLNYYHFVYISSVDVYEQNSIYAMFKRFAESMVVYEYTKGGGVRVPRYTILRCPVLLGYDTMKPNHINKMLNEKKPNLTLSPESTFNYILYDDLLNFFKNDKHKNYRGLFDFVSNTNIKLKDVAKEINPNVKFGDYVYETVNTFYKPIYVDRTSLETIRKYKENL